MISGLKVGVVIGAYNEAASLEQLLPRISRDLCDVGIVISDGSTDETSEAARTHRDRVIHLTVRGGPGPASCGGLYALRAKDFDSAYVLVSNGKHDPAQLSELMKRRFPKLQIAGSFEPPFAPLDQLCTPGTAELINRSEADVVWVGMSSPKQDKWMARMRPLLHAPVVIAVGAAFDFHSGTVKQAPRWMQRSGLEWLFRLALQPRRLWRRYLIDNPCSDGSPGTQDWSCPSWSFLHRLSAWSSPREPAPLLWASWALLCSSRQCPGSSTTRRGHSSGSPFGPPDTFLPERPSSTHRGRTFTS